MYHTMIFRDCSAPIFGTDPRYLMVIFQTKMKSKTRLALLTLAALFGFMAHGQERDKGKIAEMVRAFKQDIRGPYRDLRWFCTDGSLRPPKDPCPEEIGPGKQHARYKEEVIALGKDNHLFFGQILAATEPMEFWDSAHGHSRLKQYQIGKYLEGVDDGWILRKAQYYRGAIQSEDEAAWGRAFYQWLLAKPGILESDYFLIRQSVKDIPHSGDDNLSQRMRSQSKILSDLYPPFMDLRVKIHGQPEPGDRERVLRFRQLHLTDMSQEAIKEMDALVQTLADFYKTTSLETWLADKTHWQKGPADDLIHSYAQALDASDSLADRVRLGSEFLFDLRERMLEESRPLARLELLDLSLRLEELVFKDAPLWQTMTLEEELDKICHLGMAAAGSGYLEIWEWRELLGILGQERTESMSLASLNEMLESARAAVEWSAAMVKARYNEVVAEYAAFEPLANGFTDDRIRGSIALHLGNSVGRLGKFLSATSGLTNQVMDIPGQSSIRGLNPGYAMGELVVIGGTSEDIEVSPDKIYLFQRSPSDLKPVGGIATVAEGNLVSHVQLLARNLGIPNAALSDDNLRNLQQFDGQQVFYAVSNKGNVIMKPASEMTAEEKALFEKSVRREERITVPVDKIRLDENRVLDMREVDASDSGILCGPKAANLGQLKKMFPEKVVEGLVIPFGIFRDHMDLPMPGQAGSYWEFLSALFDQAEAMRSKGIPAAEVENYQLRELQVLRDAIQKIELKPDFVASLEERFQQVLGKPMGEIPVFLRSDTNMEDLKDFTGAGLNLTLFNVADRQKILDGIKQVWASPYTERSFKWRQRYLRNPENVFPSILVIPSVDVDCSGVLITRGINAGTERDLTLAFSRGAGGAVDGQAAETYLLAENGGYRLLAPAREPYHNRLPEAGGTAKQASGFQERILSTGQLNQVRDLAARIRSILPEQTGSDYTGPYDVELGFTGDKLWLFQIRPFVENKKAQSSKYLESISPKTDGSRTLSLSIPLP